jgi:DNA-binding transcriptional ArsR family regulator
MATKDVTRLDAQLLDGGKVLSDPVRLRILRQLPRTASCEGVLNVSELAEVLALPQSTVSRQLAILRRAGFVRSERMCRDVYYWADATVITSLSAAVRRLASGR